MRERRGSDHYTVLTVKVSLTYAPLTHVILHVPIYKYMYMYTYTCSTRHNTFNISTAQVAHYRPQQNIYTVTCTLLVIDQLCKTCSILDVYDNICQHTMYTVSQSFHTELQVKALHKCACNTSYSRGHRKVPVPLPFRFRATIFTVPVPLPYRFRVALRPFLGTVER